MADSLRWMHWIRECVTGQLKQHLSFLELMLPIIVVHQTLLEAIQVHQWHWILMEGHVLSVWSRLDTQMFWRFSTRGVGCGCSRFCHWAIDYRFRSLGYCWRLPCCFQSLRVRRLENFQVIWVPLYALLSLAIPCLLWMEKITLTEGRKSRHSFGEAISKRNFLFNPLSVFCCCFAVFPWLIL